MVRHTLPWHLPRARDPGRIELHLRQGGVLRAGDYVVIWALQTGGLITPFVKRLVIGVRALSSLPACHGAERRNIARRRVRDAESATALPSRRPHGLRHPQVRRVCAAER